MIRGSQTITKIFTKERVKYINGTQDRDICLCYRYYWYYELRGARHDDIVDALSAEFFITPDTVSKRLIMTADLLKDLVYNQPTVRQLRRKYPHLNWG